MCIVRIEQWALNPTLSWLGEMAKSLFIFLFFSLLFWTYYTRKKCRRVLHYKCYTSQLQVRWCHMIRSHDDHGKVVHRPCSSCISSVENLMATLSVTNFIWPYLHQFFGNFYGLNGIRKPLRRPFDQYQSWLKAINIGQDIEQISR